MINKSLMLSLLGVASIMGDNSTSYQPFKEQNSKSNYRNVYGSKPTKRRLKVKLARKAKLRNQKK